jgi:hypothetical protein
MEADGISSGSLPMDQFIEQDTTIPSHGAPVGEERPEDAGLQGFMARGGVEPPTPRFSVKTPDAVIWAWLQGLS